MRLHLLQNSGKLHSWNLDMKVYKKDTKNHINIKRESHWAPGILLPRITRQLKLHFSSLSSNYGNFNLWDIHNWPVVPRSQLLDTHNTDFYMTTLVRRIPWHFSWGYWEAATVCVCIEVSMQRPSTIDHN